MLVSDIGRRVVGSITRYPHVPHGVCHVPTRRHGPDTRTTWCVCRDADDQAQRSHSTARTATQVIPQGRYRRGRPLVSDEHNHVDHWPDPTTSACDTSSTYLALQAVRRRWSSWFRRSARV